MRFKKQKTDQNTRRRPTEVQPGVFSYYSQRAAQPAANTENTGRKFEKQPPLKRLNLKLGYLPSYIALVVLLGAVFYSFWLRPVPRVSVTSQPGTVHRENQAYQDGIETIWRESL